MPQYILEFPASSLCLLPAFPEERRGLYLVTERDVCNSPIPEGSDHGMSTGPTVNG